MHPALHYPVERLPRRAVLGAEIVGVEPTVGYLSLADAVRPTEVVVACVGRDGVQTATVVGEQRVGGGRLLVCQLRLADGVTAGLPAARALIGDLVRWALRGPGGVVVERERKDDGRHITYYSFPEARP